MQELRDRVAVVIGAGGGVGRGIARACAAAGMQVVAADLDEASAGETARALEADGARAIAVGADATDDASLEALADTAESTFGGLHLLSNNAGVIQLIPAIEASDDDWRWVLEVNVLGVVKTSRAFAPRMVAQGQGHIAQTASMAALVSGAVPQLSLYTASKHAVLGLCETLRSELSESGVGVSCVCPGLVEGNLGVTSGRNRPARFGGPRQVMQGGSTEGLPEAMSPELCGRLVVAGIQEGRFLILTHPEAWPLVGRRVDGFREDFDAASEIKARVTGA